MPLSDREQKILSEIESQLETDTRLANTLRKGPLNPKQLRLRTGVVGLIVGLGMLLTIAFNPWGPVVAFLGFLLMLFSAVTVGNHLKGRTTEAGGGVREGLAAFLEGRRRGDADED